MLWLERENVSFKLVSFFQTSPTWIPRWWVPAALCDHLLRVQFITPVRYSICWALSTWIIESYASLINYVAHIHNAHFRVYSTTVKIHCVGTLPTRSSIENKLIYKYIFFFPKLNIYQILHFSVMIFMAFTATARPMKKLFYMLASSFFCATNIYGMSVLLTVGGWG